MPAHVEDSAASVVQETMNVIFAGYPHVARKAGCHDYDGKLPDMAPRSSADFARLQSAIGARLDSLPDDADPDLRADLDCCRAILDHERFRIDELGYRFLGPMDWMYETDISTYMRSGYAPLADRIAMLEAHLAKLPSFLAQATQMLRAAIPAGERLDGIVSGQVQGANIRRVVRALGAQDPKLAQVLEPAASKAASACEQYAQAIGQKAPMKAQLGLDRLTSLLRVTEGILRPVPELIEQLNVEVADISAALATATSRAGAAHPRAAYEMMLEQIPKNSVLDSLGPIVRRLEEFWALNGVVPVRVKHPVEFMVGGEIRYSANLAFIVMPLLDSTQRQHLLYMPEPSGVTGVRSRGAWEYFSEPMLEMLAVHEVYAGHYVQVETAMAGPSVVRNALFRFSGLTEGWAHYVEELAIAQGLAADRPLLEVAQLRFALEAAARSLTYLSFHSGRWTLTEACEHTAAICHGTPESMARNILDAVSHQTRASYTLGKLHIREWREALGIGTSAHDLNAFHERVMRVGNAPLSTAWRFVRDAYPGAARSGDRSRGATEGATDPTPEVRGPLGLGPCFPG